MPGLGGYPTPRGPGGRAARSGRNFDAERLFCRSFAAAAGPGHGSWVRAPCDPLSAASPARQWCGRTRSRRAEWPGWCCAGPGKPPRIGVTQACRPVTELLTHDAEPRATGSWRSRDGRHWTVFKRSGAVGPLAERSAPGLRLRCWPPCRRTRMPRGSSRATYFVSVISVGFAEPDRERVRIACRARTGRAPWPSRMREPEIRPRRSQGDARPVSEAPMRDDLRALLQLLCPGRRILRCARPRGRLPGERASASTPDRRACSAPARSDRWRGRTGAADLHGGAGADRGREAGFRLDRLSRHTRL